MIRERADVVILGAGFAGSVLAMVLRRLGRSVVIVERGAHPRFAVGESSTPLANLVLESLAREYDLPRLLPLAEYGPWQRAYPHLVCGVKRGFTFFQHEEDRPFVPRPTAPTNCWSAPTRPTKRPTPTGSASTSIISSSRRRRRSGRPTRTERR